MKKVVLLLLSVSLICSLALISFSCGEDEETTTTTQPTSTTSETTTTTEPTSTSTPAPGTPKYGGTLTVAEPIFPGQPLGWPPDTIIAEPIFQQPCLEPLLQLGIDGSVVGRLATDFEVADDGSSITFTLREGVVFHDGTPFNADAVKFNYEQQIPTGKSGAVNWLNIEVLDEYTVKITLDHWYNYTLSDFAYSGGYYFVSPTAYDEHGIDWMRENMVGTGPFKQVGYERDVQVVFEKFDDYWMEGKPYVDKIIYKCVADPMTQVAALKSQELDGMASGADQRLAELVDEGLIAEIGILGVAAYFPDSTNPDSPLAVKEVREALEYAI
ncbi:MAG: ABC transporter substrate-binding protein, partial [Dehalococcoidia bacterium]